MIDTIYTAVIFLIPLALTNWALNLLYPLKKHFNILNNLDIPLDFQSLFIDNKRLLGNSTTVLGIPTALIVGITTGWLFYHSIFWGSIISVGTYGGHMLGSFIKRRLGVQDGKFLPIIDHGDYVILTGGIFFFLDKINFLAYIGSIVIILLTQPIFCFIGYKLGLREHRI